MNDHGRRGRSRGGGRGQDVVADSARGVAYDCLAAVSSADAYANLTLPKLSASRGLDAREAALATELAYGTLRRRGSLDAVVAAASGRAVAAIDPAVLDVLRLGAYQLLHTRVAAHAAVDTSVNLTRRQCGRRPSGFVNAVLRKISTQDWPQWLRQLSPKDAYAQLALRHAHPEWIVHAFAAALDDETELSQALEADNVAPAVHLCARPGRAEATSVAQSCGGELGRWSPYAVWLPGGDPARVPEVSDGNAHVQDEGSQLVAAALAAAPVEGTDARWLDLCAGPGGKSGLLGALAGRRGAAVTAVEVSAHRAELTRQATAGLPVTTVCQDGRGHRPRQPYDRVLVDVPCSGLGALRRRPEARWRRSESDVEELTGLQAELLAQALRVVRPGGVVGYVTCSPDIRETAQIVAGAHGVTPIDVRTLLPSTMPHLGEGPTVQLWPHRHGVDAMYCAMWRRERD